MKGRIKKRGRRRRSLSKTVIRFVVAVALLIFIISSLLNWGFMRVETSALLSITGDSSVTRMKSLLESVEGIREFSVETAEIYRSIPEEIRRNQSSVQYRMYFAGLENSEIYHKIAEILNENYKTETLYDLYYGFYDRETAAVVVIFDPTEYEEKDPFPIGTWTSVGVDEIEAFYRWREQGSDYFLYSDRIGKILTIGREISVGEDDAFGVVLCDLSLKDINDAALLFTVLYLIVLALAIIVIIVIARILIQRRIVKPIRRISDAALDYAEAKKEGKDGPIFSTLDIRTRDELQELGRVMSEMEREITEYEADLMQATADKERIQTELSVATAIQSDMLPNRFPAFADRTDFEIYATMNPAKEVGGDFYDFFLIDEEHLALVVADVSGKGIPAALFMMSTMIIINNFASIGYPPAKVLEKSNEKICATNRENMFVTVWFGILDLKTGVVTAANAGHEYPVIRHAGGEFELLKDRHGIALGAIEGARYKEYAFTLEKDAELFVYTDGVVEATDDNNVLFGTDRLLSSLNHHKELSPEELLPAVRRDVDRFVKDAPQFDDLTMMCIIYHGKDENPLIS